MDFLVDEVRKILFDYTDIRCIGSVKLGVEIDEWVDVPHYVHNNAQVHINNGIGIQNSSWFRYKMKNSAVWKYTNGSVVGAKGHPRKRYVGLKVNGVRRQWFRHQLVLLSTFGEPPDGKYQVCHVNKREADREPDDSPNNLYWGDHYDNAADRAAISADTAIEGGRRIFKGKRQADTEWTVFASQKNAEAATGVKQSTISYALKNGWPSGDEKWTFCWVPMDISKEELPVVVYKNIGMRFITKYGRLGEFKVVRGKYIPVEFAIRPGDAGYVSDIHRKVMECYAFDKIIAFESEHGERWSSGTRSTIQVDHINGIKTDNKLSNLRLVTQQMHSDKHARGVRELDAATREPIEGHEWKSSMEAERATGIPSGSILAVCREDRCNKTAGGGRIFEFLDATSKLRKRLRSEL